MCGNARQTADVMQMWFCERAASPTSTSNMRMERSSHATASRAELACRAMRATGLPTLSSPAQMCLTH